MQYSENMTMLKKIWNGKYNLSKSYWFFGNIIPFFLFLAIFLVAIYFQEHRLESLLALRFNPSLLFQKIILLIMTSIFFAYCFIATIGVWRSSNNYVGKKIWSILAKISIVLAFLFYIKDFNKLFW
jgi:hypothetical protein